MEKKTSQVSKMYHPRTLANMKLALAMVIIRNTPKSTSSREYTRVLSLRFSDVQSSWKEKVGSLEDELLRARQLLAEVHIEQVLTASRPPAARGCSAATSSGYPAPAPASAPAPTHHLTGSAGSIRTEMSQKKAETSSSVLVTCGSSGEKGEVDKAARTLDSNLHFLQKFARFRSLTEGYGGNSSESCPHPLSLLLCTAAKAIEGVADVLGKTAETPSCVERQSIQGLINSAVGFLDESSEKTENECRDLIAACNLLMKAVLDSLTRRHWCCNSKDDSGVLWILAALASSHRLVNTVLLLLLEWIEDCVKNLQQAEQDVTLLDPVLVSSTGDVSGLLCSLLNQAPSSSSAASVPISRDVQERVTSLRESVCKLVLTFPLFSFMFWKLEHCMRSIVIS